MITLDPEFVGSLAPPSKLTTETTFDGKPTVEIPYARLPRLERLKVSGKADETEVDNEEEGDGDDPNGKKQSREEREKRKMRGKGKSLKRFACSAFHLLCLHDHYFIDTCASNGKMSLILPR
jgi:U3 small nucleolar RNA-associated protein 7